MSDTWSSNTDSAGVADRIARAKRVTVTTHAKPDGDALGSLLALIRACRLSDRAASGVLIGPCPGWVLDMASGDPVIVVDPATHHRPAGPVLDDAGDLAVIVDTGSWSQLEAVRERLEEHPDRCVVVDHHRHGDAEVADSRWIEPTAPAAASMVADVCVRLMGLESATALPVEVATPLFLGLATDTGWFRYSNVTPDSLRLAGDLVDAGVEHALLYRRVMQQDDPSRLKLMARALDSLEFHHANRVALMQLRRHDFISSGAEMHDTGGFVDLPMSVSSVEVTVLLCELHDGQSGEPVTKISLRSKPGEHVVDVNVLAQRFGGGGHTQAAGARVKRRLEDVRAEIVEALG